MTNPIIVGDIRGVEPAVLSQLQPFNEARFDACMAYLGAKRPAGLTPYDMVKLHVMIDLHHTVAHGQPVIGGRLEAWQYGPVIVSAYKRVKRWAYHFDEKGVQPDRFDIVRREGNALFFTPSDPVDSDDFSPAEVDAMEFAWDWIEGRLARWKESQAFFHSEDSPIGRVWTAARQRNTSIDWRELVSSWCAYENRDASLPLGLMSV